MAKVSPWEFPSPWGRGHWWPLLEERGHGMGKEHIVDFPSCCGARELRLIFWHFCSQSSVCTEQGPALVHTLELWETQTPTLLGAGHNGGTIRSPSSLLAVQAWWDVAVPQFSPGDWNTSLALEGPHHGLELGRDP